MTLKRLAKQTVFILVGLVMTSGAFALPTKTQCPKFIAEKQGEIYYPRENYRCFASARAAERSGFLGTRALVAPNYSGWWRWNLTLKSNNCGGPTRATAATTYFLQLKHDPASGLFGSLCPGSDTFVGAAPPKDPSLGFSITSTRRTTAEPFCNGLPATISYVFEARNFDALFTESKTAKLTQVTVCDTPANLADAPARRCSASFSGAGARESTDHRFWPQISNNTNEFGVNCTAALTTCQGCHAAPQ